MLKAKTNIISLGGTYVIKLPYQLAWDSQFPFKQYNNTKNVSLTELFKLKDKICEICQSQQDIQIHHKNRKSTENNIENLQILCKKCHLKQHRNRKRAEFDDLVVEIKGKKLIVRTPTSEEYKELDIKEVLEK